jgi:hypothetical protein
MFSFPPYADAKADLVDQWKSPYPFGRELISDMPMNYLTYDTLNRPRTYGNVCITPNCPLGTNGFQPQIPVYSPYWTGLQKEALDIGAKRYFDNYQQLRLSGCPVFNSNMKPACKNYVVYAAT